MKAQKQKKNRYLGCKIKYACAQKDNMKKVKSVKNGIELFTNNIFY